MGIVFDFVSKVNCTELRAVGSGQVADSILRVKGEFEDGVLGDCVEKVGRKSHIVSDVLDCLFDLCVRQIEPFDVEAEAVFYKSERTLQIVRFELLREAGEHGFDVFVNACFDVETRKRGGNIDA